MSQENIGHDCRCIGYQFQENGLGLSVQGDNVRSQNTIPQRQNECSNAPISTLGHRAGPILTPESSNTSRTSSAKYTPSSSSLSTLNSPAEQAASVHSGHSGNASPPHPDATHHKLSYQRTQRPQTDQRRPWSVHERHDIQKIQDIMREIDQLVGYGEQVPPSGVSKAS
ncbi:MAG: hypothetical protein M1834_006228 [Cirrosporium novae-zelandiae]|nr:MAG: hypothetical protein M1834_006228 [Cirrosporium novae-zelandiae]